MLFYEYFFLRKTQKELSQKYNMSRNTIRRIFKNEIEISPGSFVKILVNKINPEIKL